MNCSSLKSIFLNPKMKEEVARIHNAVRGGKTLREDFARNTKTFQANPKIVAEMRKADPQFNSLDKVDRVDLISINVFVGRHGIMSEPAVSKILDVPNPDIREVEEASMHAKNASQALAFKTFVLGLDRECELGQKLHEDNYYGMQAYTSPVHDATVVLFGESFKGNQYRHTVFCIELAKELKVSPMYVNTVLWVLGMRIREQE